MNIKMERFQKNSLESLEKIYTKSKSIDNKNDENFKNIFSVKELKKTAEKHDEIFIKKYNSTIESLKPLDTESTEVCSLLNPKKLNSNYKSQYKNIKTLKYISKAVVLSLFLNVIYFCFNFFFCFISYEGFNFFLKNQLMSLGYASLGLIFLFFIIYLHFAKLYDNKEFSYKNFERKCYLFLIFLLFFQIYEIIFEKFGTKKLILVYIFFSIAKLINPILIMKFFELKIKEKNYLAEIKNLQKCDNFENEDEENYGNFVQIDEFKNFKFA